MSSRGRPVGARIDAVYAELAKVELNCKRLCQYSCGSVGMNSTEQQRILARHGIRLPLFQAFVTPGDPLGRCPALTEAGDCGVYESRPAICRLWGLTERLACRFGCVPEGGFLPEETARALLRQVRHH